MKASSAILKMKPKREEGVIAANIEEILHQLGEEPKREGLLATPMRAEKALKFLTSGYETQLEEIVNGAIFNEKCDEMVVGF